MQFEENQSIEIDLLLEALWRKYGYDFRNYARASLERRILHRLASSDVSNISEMTHQLLYNRAFMETVVEDFSVNVTEMFRDPPFFRMFREKVIPFLRTYPFLRIWVPGCSSGEEVYSIAIILKEEGLYENTQIYATDFNETILEQAKKGIYSMDLIRSYTANYHEAGGVGSFSDYYTAHYNSAIIDSSLKSQIVFASHNLATDEVFNEMQLISCRNVLIYFNKVLKNRVLKLFRESLCPSGILCLGTKESLRFSDHAIDFENVVENEKIFWKK